MILGAGWLVGCAHASRPTPSLGSASSPRLLASLADPVASPAVPIIARSGLIVTMTVRWYPASAKATVTEAAPPPESRRCRIVSERAVVDVPDAATSARAERCTIEDVALKTERPTAEEREE